MEKRREWWKKAIRLIGELGIMEGLTNSWPEVRGEWVSGSRQSELNFVKKFRGTGKRW